MLKILSSFSSYCQGKGPNLTESAKFLKVSFISNNRKQSSGAICRVECVETAGKATRVFVPHVCLLINMFRLSLSNDFWERESCQAKLVSTINGGIFSCFSLSWLIDLGLYMRPKSKQILIFIMGYIHPTSMSKNSLSFPDKDFKFNL